MKLLIKVILSVLFAPFAFAGVSGGGGGPRPTMDVFMTRQDGLGGTTDGTGTRSEVVDLGVSGGGTGPRPEMVRLVGQDENGVVIFNYKSSQSLKVETHLLPADQFAQPYLEALRRSELSKGWESVSAK